MKAQSKAIRISGLSKAYRIRQENCPQATNLREVVGQAVRNAFQRPEHKTFWALREIDLEIERGEVVGVIGRNGAGKSTLLKVLSRITEPTNGRIELHGRVGSLLEVGTGFHPELTGRENVFLNGAILGMRQREIKRQFDAIVGFAGVEEFLDTPVKRYSSGMYVRLAFAVAAHLNPEILIVDEVLAVGDAEFQRKCLGKMQDVAQGGRTVLFVSHNMGVVHELTDRCILLNEGKVADFGDTGRIVSAYLRGVGQDASLVAEHTIEAAATQHDQLARITRIAVCNSSGTPQERFASQENIYVEIDIEAKTSVTAQIAYRLNNAETGETVFTSGHNDNDSKVCTELAAGTHRAVCRVPAQLVRPGVYQLLAAINGRPLQLDLIEEVLRFEVSDHDSMVAKDGRAGAVTPCLPWELRGLADETHSPPSFT